MVRGHDRFTIIGGKWKKFDEHGNETGEWIGTQKVPKYPEALERYIFEMLCPAENYGTPELWEAQFTLWIDGQSVETLGPFPREGEYELVKVLETPTMKEYVPLTEAICDALVVTAKLNRELPERIRRESAANRREYEEKTRQAKIAAMINDIAVSQTMRQPHVIVPDMSEISKYS